MDDSKGVVADGPGAVSVPLTASLLVQRQRLTDELADSPYDLVLYLRRAAVYAALSYPDLAAGDAYRALLLTDEVADESFEYHEPVLAALAPYVACGRLPDLLCDPSNGPSGDTAAETPQETPQETRGDALEASQRLAQAAAVRCYQTLARSLLLCGCLRSAHSFCQRGLAAAPDDRTLRQTQSRIDAAARRRLRRPRDEDQNRSGHDGDKDDNAAAFSYDPEDLPDRGVARREVYPWNTYNPDRFSAASLAFLNAEVARVAPKCEVRATELPVLTGQSGSGSGGGGGNDDDDDRGDTPTPTCRQLGLFAKEPIAAGEVVLREYSLLTANNRHKEAACDACGAELPRLEDIGRPVAVAADPRDGHGCRHGPLAAAADDDDSRLVPAPVGCPEGCDTVFCDETCAARALAAYHPAVCDKDVDAIAKDPEHARDADDALYVLLLARLLAMAAHQECHPLNVTEVRYIWGDFRPSEANAAAAAAATAADADVNANADSDSDSDFNPTTPPWTLPFSFEANIATPLHILEKMDLDVFADLARYDLWVLNTLYAKFRGTASARKSRRDGRPDVAAVHPLWCLANHDCDPNVTWEWGGRMVLWAREQRVLLDDATKTEPRPGGIAAGEEILNHYCDVDLPVQLRREWAVGSLGGWCMCQRCRDEAKAATERGFDDECC